MSNVPSKDLSMEPLKIRLEDVPRIISETQRFSGWGIAMLKERPDAGYVLAKDYDSAMAELLSARLEIERLRAALAKYGHHTHPNCHDLTLNDDGSFGPRNGCLCGFESETPGDHS